MTEKRAALWRNPYVIIFVLALIMRLVFFGALLSNVGPDRLIHLTTDVGNYYSAAQQIYNDFDFNHKGIVIFGPGYPTALVVLGFLFGLNPVVLTLQQIVLSSLGSALIAYFAFQLTGNRIISAIAGLQNALSLISIGLSSLLLSETMFFVITLLAFIAFWEGLKKNKIVYFIAAGLLFGAASLTRSVGQFLPFIVIFLAVVYNWKPLNGTIKSFYLRMIGPLATTLIALSIVGACIWHNERVHNFSDLTLSTPFGVSKLVRLTRAEISGSSYEEASLQFDEELKDRALESGHNKALSVYSKESILQLLKENPLTLARVYLANVWYNMTIDWGGKYLLGTGESPWQRQVVNLISTDKTILMYRVIALILIGILALCARREFRLVLILTSITMYFGLLSGFTLDQGSRVFYPGQVAWAILVAYGLFRLYEFSRALFLRLKLKVGL